MAIFRRQSIQFLVDDFAELPIGGRTVVSDSRDFTVQRLDAAPLGCFRPCSHCHPRGHAIEPRPDRIARTKVASPTDEDQKRRLERVFDVRLMSQHAAANA